MNIQGSHNPSADLNEYGIVAEKNVYWNLDPKTLVDHSLSKNQGVLSDKGALCISTGRYTGRSPKDRFIVRDATTSDTVDWGEINKPIDNEHFLNLKSKLINYLGKNDIYVKDCHACANKDYNLNVRLVAEQPWSAQFANNMFLRLTEEEIHSFTPDWTIFCAPGFLADPAIDGTLDTNFAILNFTSKEIIIGGTGYTGEIKKGIFSVLNFILPKERNTLSMHCSANVGVEGDTAIFFGLSGTGKTTLSADPKRNLIGDDEHGWSKEGVFNFEGGCYAKCIDLTEEKEPQIFNAIREGAILENIVFKEGTNTPDYFDVSITQNTRVSYPIDHIDNALQPSKAGHPKNIFFLTCDAFGVLPPISKLTRGQAMYHFISGYTAKVAGTEDGVKEPMATFSSCFGAPFLPLHPTAYAEKLGQMMVDHNVNVWLINTGWTGGGYGVGSRIKLRYTRAMITSALNGQLDDVRFNEHEIFGVEVPSLCPNVPSEVLNPKETWSDPEAYDKQAKHLADLFVTNFEKFANKASQDVLAAAPVANAV